MRKVLIILMMLGLPWVASAQESTPALNFYSHPTERYHVLIPAGWENRSTAEETLIVNETLGASIHTMTMPATDDMLASMAQAYALRFPDASGTPTTLAPANLTNGSWQQIVYALPDGGAISAFGQEFEDTLYVLFFRSEAGVRFFITQTDAALDTVNSVLAPLEAQAATLTEDVTTLEAAGNTWQALMLTAGDAPLTLISRASTQTSTDILLAPSAEAAADHAVVFTMLRDFFVTPNTTAYLWLGIALVAGLMGFFVLSLMIRRRNFAKDEAALRELSNEA
jgi:hypothetical protein